MYTCFQMGVKYVKCEELYDIEITAIGNPKIPSFCFCPLHINASSVPAPTGFPSLLYTDIVC